ncbi:MAG TPA: sigma-70 family RNA polymerase sigma factor [Gaiellaceae bacterium]|nr:sigma-70 family RNA polymerase sigma factor [Gaiellaceae bacterium]
MAGRADTERDLERLYRMHRRDVYRSVLRSVRNPDEAEDVTQIAFLDAYRALQRGDEPERPRAWLLTIAQNVARRRYARSTAAPREVELVAEALVAPDEHGPTAGDIRRAFEQLGARQREALVLREIAGRSYREIAAALDLSVPAVETLLFRARRAFRQALAGGEAVRAGRRTLAGLLALAVPTGAREAAASAGGWLVARGATAKLAGGLAATALGTGLVVHSAPQVLGGAEEPSARTAVAPAGARDATSPAVRAAAAAATKSRPARKGKAAAPKAARPAREPRADAPEQTSQETSPPVVPVSAVEEAAAPAVGVVGAAAGGAKEATAPVADAAADVLEEAPEPPELPGVDSVSAQLP